MSTDARTSAEIQRDLDRERAQLASSLDALEKRFSIEGITRQVADQISHHSGDIGRSALNSVKSNPMPVALTGIGLAWMMLSDATNRKGEASSSARGASQRWDRADIGIGYRTRASAEDLRNRLYEGTNNLSEAAKKRVVEAREAAYRAQSEFERSVRSSSKQLVDYFDEQPLVAGALALAFGAALGAALPRTETEDRALGETSDQLLEEAERVFREEIEKAEDMTQQAGAQTAQSLGASHSSGTTADENRSATTGRH